MKLQVVGGNSAFRIMALDSNPAPRALPLRISTGDEGETFRVGSAGISGVDAVVADAALPA